jgi:hypothetical protein
VFVVGGLLGRAGGADGREDDSAGGEVGAGGFGGFVLEDAWVVVGALVVCVSRARVGAWDVAALVVSVDSSFSSPKIPMIIVLNPFAVSTSGPRFHASLPSLMTSIRGALVMGANADKS